MLSKFIGVTLTLLLFYRPFTELLGNLDELKNVRHAVPRASQQKKNSEVKSGELTFCLAISIIMLKGLKFSRRLSISECYI